MSTNSYITENNKLVNDIIDIYEDYGSSLEQIANFLNIKKYQVYYILRKSNVKLRSIGRPKCNINRDDISNLRNAGVPMCKIANNLGCSVVTLYARLNRKI